MICQTALLGLLLAANLNATPILAAGVDSGSAVKRQVLQERIAKRQAKLAEARAELQQAEAEARADQ